MCGLIAYVGIREAQPILLDGLKKLRYRGYDSAGIATVWQGNLFRSRAEGKIDRLEAALEKQSLQGSVGIGHTRWATHGLPTEANAHPHMTEKVGVVHNGIIENYDTLKKELQAQGVSFSSQTDTEVIVHLFDREIKEGKTPCEAARNVLPKLEGAYSIAVIFADFPDTIIGARLGPPLALGRASDGVYLGSDALALSGFAEQIQYLEDGDWVEITTQGLRLFDRAGHVVERPVSSPASGSEIVGKDGFRHYMLKEIYEQPHVINRILEAYIHPTHGCVNLPLDEDKLRTIKRCVILACGTSYYAGMVAKYWLETYVGIPVEVDIASEARYRSLSLSADTLCIFISQSGETADTLAALSLASQMACATLSVVNVAQSSLDRLSQMSLYTYAGPEIGVASTKAFTGQLAVFALLSLWLGRIQGRLTEEQEKTHLHDLIEVPLHLENLLSQENDFKKMASFLYEKKDMLFLGRNLMYPIAMEGALKMKELSYIHAEGYPAGELKHGPLALVDNHMPVVVFVPNTPLLEKIISNIQEVRARGGQLFIIGDHSALSKMRDMEFCEVMIPGVSQWVTPLLYVIPAQFLAYYVACLKGTDVDQPRNLAKSVTVE